MARRIVSAREQAEMLLPWREATPWRAKEGDPTYQVPTSDLKRHRQFSPAITTPQQMNRSLWTPSWDNAEPYRNWNTDNFSSGGSSQGSTEEQLVDAFESGAKLPPVEIVTNGHGAVLGDGNHRTEVADMLSHPELESYIHYDPHEPDYLFDKTNTVDPDSALGKHIHKLVQNHPYQPVDGGPTTDHVFRRHPQTGEWQRGKVDHSSSPHFVDNEDYLQQMKALPDFKPGTFDHGTGTYFDVDFGDGPQLTHERLLHARRTHRTAERADKFEWQRGSDGGWELATRNPDGNRVTIKTSPSRGQYTTAAQESEDTRTCEHQGQDNWPHYCRGCQRAREKHAARPQYGPDKLMGVNINDTLQDFTGQILSGDKTVETRDSKSLHPYVGKRIGILSTHKKRVPTTTYLVGFASVGEPKFYDNAADFDADYDLHRVAPGSDFHIDNAKHGVKWGYPVHDVKHVDPVVVDTRGNVARNLTQHMHLASADEDYFMDHRPPGPHYGAPAHQLDGEPMPDDVYDHLHHYHGGAENAAVFKAIRGKPDAMVDIYRSLPHGNTHFNHGDWVTTNEAYARESGYHATDPEQDLPVIHSQVPAKHLYTSGDSLHEFGYWGPKTPGALRL